MRFPVKGRDLASLNPVLALEWDYELNALGPEYYFPHSNATVNWVCQNGHKWPAKVNNRVSHDTHCPFCEGKRPIPGINDLATLYPHLAEEWSPNNKRPPSDYLPKSNQRVEWICKKCGHHWRTKIYHRTDGTGCPCCNGLRPILHVNDLETVHPDISKEWHPTKNNERLPRDFLPHSHYEAMWICPKGHEYPSPIYRRVRGCGCSICDGKRIVPGVNDLAFLAPHLAESWHPTKNLPLTPQMVALHHNDRVWWHCQKCGHEWQASPNNRISKGTGCPKCSHHCVDPDLTSLQAVNPILALQFDIEKNAPLTPRDVAAFDNRDYYWTCDYGHSWQASISNRNNGKKCPYCSGRRPIIGRNDLKSVLPLVASEFHPEKNGDALPEHYMPNSRAEVWWKCSRCGHEWKQAINLRATGSSCKICRCRKNMPRHTI